MDIERQNHGTGRFIGKIGFIIEQDVEEWKGKGKYFSANVKPFVDLSLGLRLIGEESVLLVNKSEKHLDEKIRSVTKELVPIFYFDSLDFEKVLRESSVKYLVVDDRIKIMKNILRYKDKGFETVVFVQYLYGLGTNVRAKRSRSLELAMGSNIPWKFIIKTYRDLLLRFDHVISNSQTTRWVLRQIYDLSSDGTVYPPVGIDMRPIIERMKWPTKKLGILVFAGDLERDYFSRNIITELKYLRKELDEPIKLFVSNHEATELLNFNDVEVYSRLPVEELVRLYVESKATYIPTAVELFGHTSAESVLCGTPSILDEYHPVLETFPMETNAITIASHRLKISEVFLEIMNQRIDIETARKYISEKYSAEESARALVKSIGI